MSHNVVTCDVYHNISIISIRCGPLLLLICCGCFLWEEGNFCGEGFSGAWHLFPTFRLRMIFFGWQQVLNQTQTNIFSPWLPLHEFFLDIAQHHHKKLMVCQLGDEVHWLHFTYKAWCSTANVRYQELRLVQFKRQIKGIFVYSDSIIVSLPGHDCGLQAWVMISGPSNEQSLPPYWGKGFVQFLVLFIVPPPQVTLQVVHEDHSVYPPFTKTTHHL